MNRTSGFFVLCCLLAPASEWMEVSMPLMLIDGFRLESTTKSPVMTHYNESCKGIPLIRSMGMYREFMQRMYDTNKENCR